MAREGTQFLKPYPAAADLSGSQYLIVAIDASEEIDVAGAGLGAGILIDDPPLGENGSVVILGLTKVIAAGALNAGVLFASDATGKAVAAAAADIAIGMTLKEAGAANQVIDCVVVPSYRGT
jgi:hypothetical protein